MDKRPNLTGGSKNTVFGKLLTRFHNARVQTRLQAEHELWRRNGLGNPAKRDGYKLAHSEKVMRDGNEVREIRLYKLIDTATITIDANVQTTTEFTSDNIIEGEANAGQTSTD